MADNPYAPNGAAGYMKRLYDKRGIAESLGIDKVSLCHGGVNFTDSEKYLASRKAKLKSFVKRVLKKTGLGTRVANRLGGYRRGSNAIAMFGDIAEAPDAVIFNDSFVHDLFDEKFPDYDGLRVQIMHNSGEFGKMFMIAAPKTNREWLEEHEARTLAGNDVFVFVGEKNKERFDSLHPECAEKSVHVHLGIDDMGKNPSRDAEGLFVFVAVGTVCARKNQHILLDVMQDEEIRRRVRFVVVGGGDDFEPCKERSEELGLSDAVRYVGPSSHVVDWYRQADGFISVSLDEGLPTVAIEAMSCGLPLLLTDVGGCAELVEGNGVLVSSCDVGSITQGIKEFLALHDEGRISGEISRKLYLQRYTTEVMWREWAALLRCHLGNEKSV